MNRQSVRIFLSIVEHKSISGAARALHFTQPTVSGYLNQLEKDLGTQLILRERGARKIMLTQAGESFIPIAKRWMELEDQVEQFIQLQKRRVFRLAASSYAHENIVSNIVYKLMQENPELEIQLISREIREIRAAIESHDFDAAIYFGGPTPLEHLPVKIYPFFQEERYVLCTADTVLPDRVLLPTDLDPQFEVSVMMAVDKYIQDPRSWALMPAGVAKQMIARSGGRLSFRHVVPAPPPRSCYILVSPNYPDAGVIRRFLHCCGAYADERDYLENKLPGPGEI